LHEPFIEQNNQVFANMLVLLQSLDESWLVVVRPHPAYTGDINNFIEKIQRRLPAERGMLRFAIESPRHVTPTESLSRSRIVASCVSTMLLEGWLAGCKLAYFAGVMDDAFILERYQGSGNVLIISSSVPAQILQGFIDTPAELGQTEDSRIDHVVCMSAEVDMSAEWAGRDANASRSLDASNCGKNQPGRV
jgi:hypothetical protein